MRMTTEAPGQRTYVPAAGWDWLLPLYDVLARLTGSEAAHRQLVDQADVEPGHRVLDIGCGTGNLTLLIRRLHPRAEIVGLDPDPKALARARRKAGERGVEVRLDRGFSDELPYADASFDHVFSAFMLHHLTLDVKEKTVREVRRVLRSGGAFHALDFGGAGHANGILAHLFHRAHFGDQHRIPVLMREARFAEVTELTPRSTILGTVSYWRASAAGQSGPQR
jgi:ubiquinone/menaquinone biosynthesis C-methylase UbiE